MAIMIELQNTIDSQQLPSESQQKGWLSTALQVTFEQYPDLATSSIEITIRVVSDDESRQLNSDYRGKDKPTNVLSFPFEMPDMIPVEALSNYLGDLAICEAVLIQEAREQAKPYHHHYAHLLIHGLLHLLGFDHIEPSDAEQMEALEICVLEKLNIANPYLQKDQ